MKRNRLFGQARGALLVALVFTLVVSVASCGNKKSLENTEYIDFTKQETQNDTSNTVSAYELAVATLLGDEAKSLYEGYAVEEDFLTWVTDGYGENVVEALAETVNTGALQDALANTTQEAFVRELWHENTGKSMHVLWYEYCTKKQNEDACLSQEIYVKDCKSAKQTVLDFTGDINFSEGWYTTNYMDTQANGIKDCLSEDLRLEMAAADLLIVNNEFVYSERGTALEGKAYTYRAKPSRVTNLTTLGVDLAGLANNHTYDYGPDALLDTFEVLEEEGIPYVGAGRNLEEATKPVYFIVNGRKIAIVAATQIERSYNYTKQATETTPGVIKCLNPDLFVEEIKEAKASSDYVMVFVHWGTEREAYFAQDQTDLAKAFIEAGADVIIGGHTHCLQGITFYEEVPVFFSLGNFWQSKATLDTGIAQVIIDDKGELGTRFLPCVQSGCKTKLITKEAEKTRILNYMDQISKEISFDADGYVSNDKTE